MIDVKVTPELAPSQYFTEQSVRALPSPLHTFPFGIMQPRSEAFGPPSKNDP